MDLKTRYPANAKTAHDGVEVKIGEAVFILTYYNSSKTQLIFQAEVQKLSRNNTAADAVLKAMQHALVEVTILGWENLLEDGESVEYSKENCSRILKEYVGLDVEIMEKAANIELFKKEKEKEIEGK